VGFEAAVRTRHPACVGSHKKRGFLLRDRRLESTTHARTALSRDLGRDMDARFAVARRYYDLPRKSSATSSVRRNALKRSFNYSRLRGCSRSCQAAGNTIGKQPLGQHHRSCAAVINLGGFGVRRNWPAPRQHAPSLSEYLELQTKRFDPEATQCVLRGHVLSLRTANREQNQPKY